MKLAILIVAIAVVGSIGCSRSAAENHRGLELQREPSPTPEPTKPPIPSEIASLSAEKLCDKLADIEILPTKDPTITDPIYEALIAKGDVAIPCLIEKITDKRKVPDPRYSVPHWHSFAVGDTAVFILLDIISKDDSNKWEKLMLDMLPPKYEKEWESNGIYAYFNCVYESKNRKKLQDWWKKWLNTNRNEQ